MEPWIERRKKWKKNMMHSNVAVCEFENMWYGFQRGY